MAVLSLRYFAVLCFLVFVGSGCMKKTMKSSVASESTEGMRYPIYRVGSRNAGEFIAEVQALKSKEQVAALSRKYGVSQTEPKFWAFQDFVHKWEFDRDPLRAAFADISDYQISEMPTDPVE